MTRPLTIVPRRLYSHGIDAGRAIAAFIPLPIDLPNLPRSAHVHARASRAALIFFSIHGKAWNLWDMGFSQCLQGDQRSHVWNLHGHYGRMPAAL